MKLLPADLCVFFSVTAAVFSGARSRERSRESVIRQLRNMDQQLQAIDDMSVSMQKDLNSTKLVRQINLYLTVSSIISFLLNYMYIIRSMHATQPCCQYGIKTLSVIHISVQNVTV